MSVAERTPDEPGSRRMPARARAERLHDVMLGGVVGACVAAAALVAAALAFWPD